MLRVRAFLFDLDGVLADSIANVERHWRNLAARHAIDPDALLRVVHGRRAIDTIREVVPPSEVDAEYRRIELAESTDTEGTTVVPGAAELLAALPRDSWAVVTSGTRRVALARLAAVGLPIPPLLVTAEDLTRGKPDPEGYLRAARALGVAPGDCVVVEDAPVGAAAARAAGMRLIGVTTTYPADRLAPADLIVPDLTSIRVAIEHHEDGRPTFVITTS
jgi:sugar-phosphatase